MNAGVGAGVEFRCANWVEVNLYTAAPVPLPSLVPPSTTHRLAPLSNTVSWGEIKTPLFSWVLGGTFKFPLSWLISEPLKCSTLGPPLLATHTPAKGNILVLLPPHPIAAAASTTIATPAAAARCARRPPLPFVTPESRILLFPPVD